MKLGPGMLLSVLGGLISVAGGVVTTNENKKQNEVAVRDEARKTATEEVWRMRQMGLLDRLEDSDEEKE